MAPAAQLRVARSLFVILSTAREPVGVGFFVGPDLAVTADHVLADTDVPRSNSLSPRCLVDVKFYDASGQHTLDGRLEVVLRKDELDVAVLTTLHGDSGAFCVFLTLSVFHRCKQSQMTPACDWTSGRDVFLDLDVSDDWIVGHEVVLCAFQIGLDNVLLAQFGRSLALAKARFTVPTSATGGMRLQVKNMIFSLRVPFSASVVEGITSYMIPTRTSGTLVGRSSSRMAR